MHLRRLKRTGLDAWPGVAQRAPRGGGEAGSWARHGDEGRHAAALTDLSRVRAGSRGHSRTEMGAAPPLLGTTNRPGKREGKAHSSW